MEAALISLVIDKVGGIIIDQAQRTCSQLLLQYTIPPLDQIHARMERNAAKFRVIQSFLETSNRSTAAAAAAAAADEEEDTLEAWIKEVRAVTFEMEDIIDEHLYLVGEQRGRTWKDYLLRPSILCCNLAKAWRGIDSRLENMEKHLSELENMNNLYGLNISGNADRVLNNSERDIHDHYRVCDPSLIDEDDVVGIEENKSKLLSWLTNADTCRKMTTIAVWGMGGLGKTTLVSNVYRNNAVKSYFDCQVWVTVSQNYSVGKLLRTMIQEIFKENIPHDITSMTELRLFNIIRENLQQKRYFVVLDDVWNENLWNQIHHAFIDSNNGSRLIVTTRIHEVARIASEEHIMELQQLNKKDAWSLFCKKAFRKENNNDCPQELEDYARKILNKCEGSPLAIAVIGNLLSTKEKSESGRKEVYDCLHWEFEKNSSLGALKRILNLSFNDLPNYLKNCFVYCSIFPEDYLIKRNKLIQLWVAEGFVKAKSRVMEEEAEYYLAQLVDRSMLQVVERNDFGRMKAFRMHDVVREVTLEISKNIRFSMIFDGSQSVLDNQSRRLSIQTNVESLDLNTNLRLSQLRSLVVFRTSEFSSGSLRAVLISLKMLRVLELEGTSISNLPNEVSALFNLHYLGLRNTRVKQLPNNIQKLQSLQTLNLHNSTIRMLPVGVTQLKQLRHLITPPCEVPTLEEAWQWKNLQTLKFIRSNEKFVQRLGDMKELRSLEVAVEQAHYPKLCISLSKMMNLRCLYLSPRGEGQLNLEMLNSPLPALQKLYLWGRLFRGEMPRFIRSCAELTLVKLLCSRLIEDPLPSLSQLPKLVVLILQYEAFDGQTLQFRTGWFLSLKRLHLIRLKNLHNIVIEEGAMTNLHELSLISLRKLRLIPLGIKFLIHLQHIYLCNLSHWLMEKLKRDDDNEDLRRIRHIPNITIR